MVKASQNTPALPYVLHADLKEYRRRLGLWRLVLALGLSLLVLYRWGFVAWLALVGVIALILFILFLALKIRSVTVTETEIAYRNGIGRIQTVRLKELSDVKVFSSYIDPMFGVAPRVIIGTKDGYYLASLNALYWPLEGIDTLLTILKDKKIKIEEFAEPADSTTLVQLFPTKTSYIERHPYIVATISAVAIFGGVLVFVIVAM